MTVPAAKPHEPAGADGDAAGVLRRRQAGVLLHPTSLPGGVLDEQLIDWLDFLQAAGFSCWQMLPLGPPGPQRSPYSPSSAFAGNPELLPATQRDKPVEAAALDEFRQREAYWLEDFALFDAIHRQQGKPWWQWPQGLRSRQPASLRQFAAAHAPALMRAVYQQFHFARCWRQLRRAARQRGIDLFGDLPMFVVADSADVWSRPHLFRLDSDNRPLAVAGVPPDAFTDQGQCWDNPVYDWEAMRDDGFNWWQQRLALETRRFDLLRWDHFRGLEATWEIPTVGGRSPNSAVGGDWQQVPGRELLSCLRDKAGNLPLVAENLGIITPAVEQLRRDFHLPGMHVLQFAFDGEAANPHLPHNHERQGVAYSGTHDNNTTLGWAGGLDDGVKRQVAQSLGAAEHELVPALLGAVLASRCQLAVLPLQDLLGLDGSARMNIPGQAEGQWRWQYAAQQLSAQLAGRWREQLAAALRLV